MLAIAVNSLLSGAIFWMAFCRLDLTTSATHFSARLAIWFNGMANIFIFFSPFYWDFTPPWPMLLGLAALAVTTASTTRLWLAGAPVHLSRGQ